MTDNTHHIVDSLVSDGDSSDPNRLDSLVNPPPSLSNNATSLARIELPRQPGDHMTDEQRLQVQQTFLSEFCKRANMTAACKQAGINRSTAYYWLAHDTNFAEKYAVAESEANDALLDEAWRRGHDGVEEPVVSMGKLVRDDSGEMVTVSKYDTPLLMMLIRTRMPEYRESRQVEMNSRTQLDINTSHTLTLDTRGMSAEELATLRQLAEGIKNREQARIEKTGTNNQGE